MTTIRRGTVGALLVALALSAPVGVQAATKKATPKKKATTATTTAKTTVAVTTPATAAPPASAAPATVAALPKLTEPIKILVISPEDTASTNLPDAQIGARAAAALINKSGGVRGAKVEITWCNDKSDPTEVANCTRKASDGFITAFYAGRFPGNAYAVMKNFDQAFFDPAAGTNDELNDPKVMAFDGANPGAYAGAPYAVAKAGFKKIVIVRVDVPATVPVATWMKQAAVAGGASTLPDILFPGVLADAGPIAAQIRASGADAACFVSNASATAALFSAMAQQGIEIQKCMSDVALTAPDFDRMGSLLDGVIMSGVTPPLVLRNIPKGVDAYVNAVLAAGYEPKSALGAYGVRAFAAVSAIAQVSATLPKPDAHSLLEGLNNAKGINLPVYGAWTPGAKGPAGFTRLSNIASYVSKFQGSQPTLLQEAPINLAPFLKPA